MHEREPTREAIEEIRAHLASKHDWTDFDLHRDVAFGDNAPPTAVIAYIAQTPTASARFRCSECPTQIFLAGEPAYGDPVRSSLLLVAHPEQEILLHGAGSLADRALLGEELDRGELARSLVSTAQKRRGMATKKADRPTVDERRSRCQTFLLERVTDGALVHEAIAALVDLRTDDPERYERITDGTIPYANETFRRYWLAIDIAERNAARAAGEAARAARRAAKSTR